MSQKKQENTGSVPEKLQALNQHSRSIEQNLMLFAQAFNQTTQNALDLTQKYVTISGELNKHRQLLEEVLALINISTTKSDIVIETAKTYCSHFFVKGILNYFTKSESLAFGLLDFHYCLAEYCNDLVHNRHSFHDEVLLGRALLTILQAASITAPNAAHIMPLTVEKFVIFSKNIRTPSLKSYCSIYLFILEYDEKLILEEKNRGHNEIYFQERILNKIAVDKEDTDVAERMAYASTLYFKVSALHEKYMGIVSHNLSVRPIINIKKPTAAFQYLREAFNQSGIFEYVKKYEGKKLAIKCYKLIQSHEIIYYLFCVYQTCSHHAILTINVILDKIRNQPYKPPVFYDFLCLSKEITELYLKICELNNKQGSAIDWTAHLEKINSEIQAWNDHVKESAEISKKLTNEITGALQNNLPIAGIISKAKKRQQLRDNFIKFTNLELPEELHRINKKAQGHIEIKQYGEAILCYQNSLANASLVTQIHIYLYVGDLYKLMSEKTSTEQERYKSLAISAYKRIIFLIEGLARNYQKQFKAVKGIAETFIESLKPYTPETDVSTDESSGDDQEPKEMLDYKFETRQIDLVFPNSFLRLYSLLKNYSYYLFPVGGYIRNSLLHTNLFDIDAIVVQLNQQSDPLTELTQLMRLIKSDFPCQIRGKRYPTLFIPTDELNIEISYPKLQKLPIHTPEELYKILPGLLYQDGVQRDTTDSALYYDIERHMIIDPVGGLDDIANNRLRIIQRPNDSFKEDVARIFRVIRLIVLRSIVQSELQYSPIVISAIKEHINELKNIDKSRFYLEITKCLFRGRGLSTWQLLQKLAIASYFFPLPSAPDQMIRHSVLVARILASLDSRIANKQHYSVSLTLATILWGKYHEDLEKLKNTGTKLSVSTINQLSNASLNEANIMFRLPDKAKDQIKIIWRAYLTNNNLVEKADEKYSFHDFRLASVLGQSITRTLQLGINRKVSQHHTMPIAEQTEIAFKEFLTEYGFNYLIQGNEAILTPDNKLKLFSTKELAHIFETAKIFLKATLGKHHITYQLNPTNITISSESPYKRSAIKSFVESLFTTDPEDNPKLYVEF